MCSRSLLPLLSSSLLSSSLVFSCLPYAPWLTATTTLDCIAMSPCRGSTHTLVACCTDESVVRMVDLASGAGTHVLIGHREAVLCAAWVPGREFQLATGGVDATVRVWDIRRASSCLATLDMNDGMGYGFGARGAAGGAARGSASLGGSTVGATAAPAALVPGSPANAPVSLRSLAPTQAHSGAVLGRLCEQSKGQEFEAQEKQDSKRDDDVVRSGSPTWQ